MPMRIQTLLAAALALALLAPPHAGAQGVEPVALVKSLYPDGLPQKDAVRRRVLTPDLVAAIKRRGLDFDPVVDGQDADITELAVNEVARSPVAAEVHAKFKNMKSPRFVRYDLVKPADGWRIRNIRGTGGGMAWDLRNLMGLKDR